MALTGFAPHTELLLEDGSVKMVKDIQVGDKLKGYLGESIIVTDTSAHTGEMFRINQTHGMSYTVSKYHLLTISDYNDVGEISAGMIYCAHNIFGVKGISNGKHPHPSCSETRKKFFEKCNEVSKRLYSERKYNDPNLYESNHYVKEEFRNDETVVLCNSLGWECLNDWMIIGKCSYPYSNADYQVKSQLTHKKLENGEYVHLSISGSGRVYLKDYTIVHV
jgi:hypothetical protein